MTISKLLPGNETVLVVPVIEIQGVPFLAGPVIGGLVPFTAPTTTLLNYWANIVNEGVTGFGAGGNVSYALRNDLKLNLDASNTDKDRDLTATGDAEILTYFKFSASFTQFRDQSLTALGTFNMAKNLFRAPDVPFAIIHRVSKSNTAPFAIGDEIDMYYAWTDNPVPGYTDGGNQFISQSFVTKNIVNMAYDLAA